MLKKNCFQLFQITGHFKCAGEFPAIINNKDDKKRGSRHSVKFALSERFHCFRVFGVIVFAGMKMLERN